jgi:hypothetical protein
VSGLLGYIICTLCVASILAGEKARLRDPHYREPEGFFQSHESSGFQGLLAICYLGLSNHFRI